MGKGKPQRNEKSGVSPTKIAELLTKGGKVRVSAKEVRADIQSGAPRLSERKMELLPYIRWLFIQVVQGAD